MNLKKKKTHLSIIKRTKRMDDRDKTMGLELEAARKNYDKHENIFIIVMI